MTETSARHSSTPPWRGAVSSASMLAALAGVWVALSVFVLGFDDGAGRWALLASGVVAVVIAVVRAGPAYGLSWLSYANAIVGVWIFASAFWVGMTGGARASSAVAGLLITLLSLTSASESDRS